MGILLNKLRTPVGPCVYLLKLENSKNSCFKVGFSVNLAERLLYYPQSFKIDVLSTITGSKEEMLELETYIHDNCNDKYTWNGKKWGGFSECYSTQVNINEWYKKFKTNT